MEETIEATYVDREESKVIEDEDQFPAPTSKRTDPRRRDHFHSLIQQNKALKQYSNMKLGELDGTRQQQQQQQQQDNNQDHPNESTPTVLEQEQTNVTDKRLKFVTQKLAKVRYTYPIEVRVKGFTYQVQVDPETQKIQTVYNSSFIYKIGKWFKRIRSGESPPPKQTKTILDDINLVLQPGKMYLLLGAPGSGKTSLLKAIAGRLPVSDPNSTIQKGTVEYNGKTLRDKSKYHIDNAVAYIEQLDNHAPRLTVEETFEFAFQCKTGGSMDDDPKEDKEHRLSWTAIGLEILGLSHVKDTFVGDSTVRGVSGGQRRRVTVGEMIMNRCPLLCGDEISTGLDSTSTFEIVDLMTFYGRLQRTCRVIALLQPSPETVALFDEVLVIAEGKLLYAGPIQDVQSYFERLGYNPPETMDVADFLQVLSTPDAAALWKPPNGETQRTTAYTVLELAQKFKESIHNKRILEAMGAPWENSWDDDGKQSDKSVLPNMISQLPGIHRKYANSFPRAIYLNLRRALTLWIRDRRVLIANAVKNAVMGLSVGGVFWQTEDVVSILGVLFQSMLFIMLGASTSAPALVDDRTIFRKHYEANFYSAYPFVIGRGLAQMPQILMDVLVFGSILYGMVGLHPSVENYFVFIAILFGFSVLINQLMAVFAARAPTKASVQVISAVILLFCILFGGFIVPPNVIPTYYIWVYWWNPFAWAYRALLCLEFQSDSWNDGDAILRTSGFVGPDDEPFQTEWIGYWFIYMVSTYIFYIFLTAIGLGSISSRGGNADSGIDSSNNNASDIEGAAEETVKIPFLPATLTFEDICYDVQSSTGKDKLRLLNNVDGIFQSGRMVALMGSSGAGKTTLLDVIALRKSSGTVSGTVKINGFPQERKSFRRASGYVEQFSEQASELTVRETILFSARLRLGVEQVKSDEEKVAFVEALMRTLELTSFADSLVGVSETGGLSFEQKKRLSIAVELAASPSILFLDEPTSGLDARSALMVVKLLRKIASEGRTICATIHQPSSAVFQLFDDLLLLKKGGRVVYFGELGDQSESLRKYFEDRGARPIERGENPSNWVLTVMTSESRDYADDYLRSEEHQKVKAAIASITENLKEDNKMYYKDEYAAPKALRGKLTNQRLMKIYWRSPSYNLSRISVSAGIALILGSVLVKDRSAHVLSETQMRAQFAVIFLSFIIVGIMSIFSVLPVMTSIRDMFYSHRAAGMINSGSVGWALGYSEKGFILFSATLFAVIFLGVSMGGNHFRGLYTFWGFFAFNIAIYSYFGQAFVCFFKPMATAQILASVFIGINNFFSGLIVRPQFLVGFFAIPYYISPGHYVYEGMITSLYHGDNRTVVADNATDFYFKLGCDSKNISVGECTGSVEDFMHSFFGGKFQRDNMGLDFIVLGAYLTLARFLTFVALHFINFSST